MKLNSILFFSLFSCQLFGTAQIPDILIYNGDTLMLYSVPLASYKDGQMSDPQILFNGSGCTYMACNRNYIATWEVIENEIYLTEIKNACYPNPLNGVEASFKVNPNPDCMGVEFADLKFLFPKRFRNGRVKADWIHSKLICPHGKLIKYFHSGFNSIYEFELELDVQNGIIQKTNRHNNSQSQKTILANNKNSLDIFLYKNINWKIIENNNSNHMGMVVVIFTTNEKAELINIEVKSRKSNKTIDNEILRVFRLIPEWDTFFRRGELIKMKWTIPVKLDKEFYAEKIKNTGK